tara:strand:- start:1396 stop:2511 length:1116 start_codon:yes stop_codon:yes gene_type:complete
MEKEKAKIEDFTIDGKPIVEPEKVEDAVEEQSTDEVSVQDEPEASGEVSEENEEVSEESTEQSEEEESQEESKEEEVEVKEEVVEEKPVERSEPTLSDYGIDEETIDLARSLQDDYIKNAVKYYRENKDLRPFLEAYQFDYDKIGDLELLRLKFERENPELSVKAKERLFNYEVLSKYKLDDKEYEEDEVELGQELLKRDAGRLRQTFIKEQQEFVPQNLPKPPSKEEQQAALNQQIAAIRNNLKEVIDSSTVNLKVRDEDPLNFQIKDTSKLVDYAINNETFWSRFINDKKEVDWELWSKTVAFVENPDAFVDELVKYGKSLGKKLIENEIKNPEPLVSKKDVKPEVGGDTPYDDPEGFLTYALKNKVQR